MPAYKQIPTLGRIVLFTFGTDGATSDDGQSTTVPAMVVAVHSDDIVNLRVFQDGDSNPLWKTSIPLAEAKTDLRQDSWQWPFRPQGAE